MVLPQAITPPPMHPDERGSVRVGNTRVTLDSVVAAFDEGAAAEEIAFRFPVLKLEDIYATITYVLQHRAAVDRYLAERRSHAGALRQEAARRSATSPLRQKLLAAIGRP